MSLKDDVQKLEPGAEVILFTLDARALAPSEPLVRFHGHLQSGIIVWQGNSYSPWPIDATGFARTGDQQPSPILRVANVDGSITALCLAFQDLVGAKIIRQRTFVKYLDAVNFPGGNPNANPSEEHTPEVWFIDRKTSEDDVSVEFELATALNFGNASLPGRQIIANNCPWQYRGAGCGYVGPPVADEMDQPTSDPAQDKCGKRLGSCQLRPWPDNVLNFGGMPAAGLVRT